MLLAAPALTSAWAQSATHRDLRRQELRQALQAQRQIEPTNPNGDSVVRGPDSGRRLTPEELLAMRRQLQEMRKQRSAGQDLPGRVSH